MVTRLPSDSAALVEETKMHIARLKSVIEASNQQVDLARALIRESEDYMVLIEEIEATRIERARQNSN